MRISEILPTSLRPPRAGPILPLGAVSFGMLPIVVVLLAACADEWPLPPDIDPALLASEHLDWQEYRRGRLVEPPSGAVIWVGLWDLPEGAVSFGTDTELPIALPAESGPRVAGTLRRSGRTVTLEPEPGSTLVLEDGTAIADDTAIFEEGSDAVPFYGIGSLGMRVHSEPGTDRLWLRAWDEEHPSRETFQLPPFFPVEEEWVVPARFDAYAEARPLTVPDVTGGFVEYQARGELVFRKDDREHRLIATAGETSSRFFVMIWDSTAVTETYQGGRYLQVDFPDEEGWTTIDFNRTYNAPCVFTPYSVCALPPRQNWLDMWVNAGEKRPDEA